MLTLPKLALFLFATLAVLVLMPIWPPLLLDAPESLLRLLPQLVLNLAAIVTSVLSVEAGFLVGASALQTHRLFQSVSFIPPRIVRWFFAALPLAMYVFTWPYVVNSGSSVPLLLSFLWTAFYILTAETLFQTPYVLSTSWQTHPPLAIDDRTPALRKRFVIRYTLVQWMLHLWKRAFGWSLWGMCLCGVTFLFLKHLGWPRDPDFLEFARWIVPLFCLGYTIFCFSRTFPLREYRHLPIQPRRYVLAVLSYHMAALGWSAVASAGLALLLYPPDYLEDPWLNECLLYVPLALSAVIPLLGHAALWSKVVPTLFLITSGVLFRGNFIEEGWSFWLLTAGLPALMVFFGVALEWWSVSYDRNAYSRKSDLEEILGEAVDWSEELEAKNQ